MLPPPGQGRRAPRWHAPCGSATDTPSGHCQARPTNLILLPQLSGAVWYTPKVSSEMRTLSRVLTSRLTQPGCNAIRLHDRKRPIPSRGVVVGEIEVQRRDLGLDGSPERPADVGHEGKEVHPGELLPVQPAKVRLAQHRSQLIVEARLLRRVAQVEARIIVPAELVIDDPQALPVVDEVLAEQVIVTGHVGERPNPDRPLDFRQQWQSLPIIGGDPDLGLLDGLAGRPDQPEHVRPLPAGEPGWPGRERTGPSP